MGRLRSECLAAMKLRCRSCCALAQYIHASCQHAGMQRNMQHNACIQAASIAQEWCVADVNIELTTYCLTVCAFCRYSHDFEGMVVAIGDFKLLTKQASNVLHSHLLESMACVFPTAKPKACNGTIPLSVHASNLGY